MLRCEFSRSSISPSLQFYSYDELVREHKVNYVAGGAAQNAARGAAVVFILLSIRRQP